MKKIFITIFLFLIFVNVAQATSFNIELNQAEVKTNGLVQMTLHMDTKGALVNALEGELVYNSKNFIVEDINLGNSFVSFWVEKPKDQNGKIYFSGIVPGGIAVSRSEVFNIVLRSKIAGETSINVINGKVFLNDGLGSELVAQSKPAYIQILSEIEPLEKFVLQDMRAPEDFKIERVKSEYVFDGEWFVVFGTQDKGSNVAYYEVCELGLKCQNAESPYLLANQDMFYHIKIIAYDSAGNKKTSTLTSPVLMLSVVLVSFVIILFMFRHFRRYFRKNRV